MDRAKNGDGADQLISVYSRSPICFTSLLREKTSYRRSAIFTILSIFGRSNKLSDFCFRLRNRLQMAF